MKKPSIKREIKKSIYDFNHITSKLSEQDLQALKDFYSHYHKKCWCYKQSYKRFKLLNISLTISGMILMITGTVKGAATLNPIVLGVINGIGLIISNMGKMKNYPKKIELSKIAFTTYEKILVELRSYLRGDDFIKLDFVEKMKIIDEMIIDQTPLADSYENKYDKKY